jgi:lysophospholipase L1-like esterase
MTRARRWAWLVLMASAAPAAAGVFLLGDEDRVVFFGDRQVYLGDPRTQRPTFGAQVESFVRVRYPALKARFWHYGENSTTTVADGNARFDDQVAPWKPTVIVLSFGLDDAGMQAFDAAKLEAFKSEMRKLIERSKATGAKVWVLTPPCPESSQRNQLQQIEYDTVIGRYAEAIRGLGTDLNVPVLDWYQAMVDYRARVGGNPRLALTTASGIDPTPLGASLATNLILSAWNAEPMIFQIHADWNSDTASVSAGKVAVAHRDADTMILSLTGIPLPWYLPDRGGIPAEDWPAARFCSYTVKIDNAPSQGFILSEAKTLTERGREAKPFLAQMLWEGADVGRIGPLATAEAVRLLDSRVKQKNGSYARAENIKKTTVTEPEFAEAFKTFTLAQLQYSDGLARIIARTPRTMDIDLRIQTATAAARQAEARTEPTVPTTQPQPPGTQPAKPSQPRTAVTTQPVERHQPEGEPKPQS